MIFLVATAGASAALTGLIFVGVSLNLKKVLSAPDLPNRALTSLTLLLSILTISIVLLVPNQTPHWIGYELLILGFIIWTIVTRIDAISYKTTPKQYKTQYLFHLLLNQISILPYLIAGFSILLVGEKGFYWIVPAIIFSFINSVVDAWVLLIEINR